MRLKLKVLLICVGSLMLMGMAPEVTVLSEQLRLRVNEIIQLKIENQSLRVQIENLKFESKNNKIALEPIRFFQEYGNNSTVWGKNPDHLKKVWEYCRKWSYLLTPEARATVKNLNVEYFAFCFAFKESHYNPYAVNINKNETTDFGMTQINSCVWDDCYKELPEELKKRKNPKTDPQVAVGLLYVWINLRVKANMSWCFLSDEAWTLMWRLNQIRE